MAKKKASEGTGLEPNIAGLLCYVLGWVSGLVFLLLEKKDKFVRFHAIQSIIVFGAMSVLYAVLFWIPIIGWVFGYLICALAFVLWILLMVKAYRGHMYKVFIAGGIAEKNA